MEFDNTLITDVLKNANVVDVISSYIEVKQKGRNHVALCPFHDDKNPSLQISAEKQIFKCFVCGTGGNAIRFVELYEHIPFMEAMRKVAEISGYHDDRLLKKITITPVDEELLPLKKCLSDLTTYYQYALATDEGKIGLDYLNDRHLNAEIRKKYLLGYAFKDGKESVKYLQSKGHSLRTIELIGIVGGSGTNFVDKNAGRVVFPIADGEGQVIGFSTRRLLDDDSPKYVNSPETKLFHKSDILYNFHNAKQFARREGYVYILEGFMDVFALDRIGIQSSVALMGTAFTEEHIKKLRSLNVELRICLDGDRPGQTAAMKMIEILKDSGLKYVLVDSRGNTKDPDDIVNEEDGEEKLKKYVFNLVSPLDFAFNYYQSTSPLTGVEERKNLVISFLPILASINSTLELDDYLRKLSNITKFDIESIKDLLRKTRNRRQEQVEDAFRKFHPERKAIKRFELAEREILFQMINNREAVEFYESKIEAFYDVIYRRLADYIVEYVKINKTIDVNGLISSIELNEDEKSKELIAELTEIAFENFHPNDCTDEYLESVLATILEEKQKMIEESTLEKMLQGKSELEKARIIAEWNRQKMKKNKGEK